MKHIQREDIHIISRFGNMTEEWVDRLLNEHIYNGRKAWLKFLRLFFISLGVGFTVSGIIFFFAYNWAELHKFAKLGLAEALIIATTSLVLFLKASPNIRNIILTGASALVGVLFAVYGQIYQTGANAYDFFLAWTVFVTLWVIVSDFAPLWLLYIVLINTTFILYTQQVVGYWSEVFVFTLLSVMNAVLLVAAILFSRYKKTARIPSWFFNVVALASVIYATIGIIIGIFNQYQFAFPILVSTTATMFALGIWYGLRTKNKFYLSVIPFSLIVMVSALFIRISTDAIMFLFICLFVVASVTLVVRNLIVLHKKWTNEG